MQEPQVTTRPRRSLLRTGGCLTCRIRKVKCDEAKPACHKCRSTGRACDGYSVLPFSRTELLHGSQQQGSGSKLAAGGNSLAYVMLTDGAFRGKLEQRYFQFFRCCTVACTNLTVDSPFWDRVILQAFHAEPAVKHAILALAAMHSGMLDRKDEYACRQHIYYAREQYTIALGKAQQLVSTATPGQMHRVLMVCLLFAAWEGVQGDYQASQRHMNSGHALFARFHNQIRERASISGTVHEIMQVLARMDISAISFSDDSAPYQSPADEPPEAGLSSSIGAFGSLQEASLHLMDVTRWLLRLGSELVPGMSEEDQSRRQAAIDEYSQRLEGWSMHWNTYYAANKIASDSVSVLNIQLWYACANALVETGFSGPETRYDKSTARFREVVELCEKLSSAIFRDSEGTSFSLDLGYLIPAFFVATRCRDPSIRRRALSVLQSYPRHEGAWQSGPAAVVANSWMEVEEVGLGYVQEEAQVPERQRVVLMQVQVQKSDGRARLRFKLAGIESSPVVEHIVRW
ncbi:hypothetical protein PWT90_10036 [Aphanocladium album]|nr:hypothetical protein PWT90_10036 [Aphanocladium album]